MSPSTDGTPIRLRITARHMQEDGSVQEIITEAEGRLRCEDGPGGMLQRVDYTDEEGNPSSLELTDHSLRARGLFFEEGARHPGTYPTPYGEIDLVAATERFAARLGAHGSMVRVAYTLHEQGSDTAPPLTRVTMTISIRCT